MITVITGPPCAGKTTYVQKNARPGDIIIDYDALAVALGSTSSHDHDPWLSEVTAAAWAAAIARATQDKSRRDTWIIDSRPRPERLQAYTRARARYVHLTAGKEELHRRADADGRPPQSHQRIDEFLAATTPRSPARVQSRTKW